MDNCHILVFFRFFEVRVAVDLTLHGVGELTPKRVRTIFVTPDIQKNKGGYNGENQENDEEYTGREALLRHAFDNADRGEGRSVCAVKGVQHTCEIQGENEFTEANTKQPLLEFLLLFMFHVSHTSSLSIFVARPVDITSVLGSLHDQ